MQYRTMPHSTDQLSVLGFGCMRLPTRAGREKSNMIDVVEAKRQIVMAVDAGVNYLDTAFPYHLGASETFLGEHILSDSALRGRVNIATKLPCFTLRKTEAFDETFNKQREKLQVDVVDYYLLHALDGGTWDRMVALGIKEWMDKVRASGKVRHMGFSFHGRKEDFIRIVDAYDWEFAQVQYNILDEHFQAGIEGIEYAGAKGLGIIVMEPLRGGSLVGNIPAPVKAIYDSAEISREPVDWALRWVLNRPEVTMVLSGMNRPDHILQNIEIVSDSLPNGMSSAELAVIDNVRDAYNALLQVGCTGCAYCMPCPAGIDIPAAFKNLNNMHMFNKKFSSRISHAQFLGMNTADGRPHWTSGCIDCGRCEEKCPQHIEVRETFAQVQRELEVPSTKIIAALGRTFSGKGPKRS